MGRLTELPHWFWIDSIDRMLAGRNALCRCGKPSPLTPLPLRRERGRWHAVVMFKRWKGLPETSIAACGGEEVVAGAEVGAVAGGEAAVDVDDLLRDVWPVVAGNGEWGGGGH
jgi:hypothetical protein